MLGEVVADHREAGGVAGVVVDDAGGTGVSVLVGVVFARDTGLGARGRARVLGIHREGPSSSVVRPSHWDASPGGGRRMSAVVLCRAERRAGNRSRIHPSWAYSLAGVSLRGGHRFGGREGWGLVGFFPSRVSWGRAQAAPEHAPPCSGAARSSSARTGTWILPLPHMSTDTHVPSPVAGLSGVMLFLTGRGDWPSRPSEWRDSVHSPPGAVCGLSQPIARVAGEASADLAVRGRDCVAER